MSGAFLGPFFAAALPSELIARLVAAMIVFVGVIVLATLKWGGLGAVRAADDVPTGRIAGVGGVAGFSSGISGAGWGPIGVKLLILLRIEPKAAIGSSLLGRVFMAVAAVVGYLITATALEDVEPDLWLLVVLFFGSVVALVPGASWSPGWVANRPPSSSPCSRSRWRCPRSSGADDARIEPDQPMRRSAL